MKNLKQHSNLWTKLAAWVALILLAGAGPALGAGLKELPGHVPAAIKQLQPLGEVTASTELHLGIGVALRDQAGLDQFLAEVYDPASPIFHHYLTRPEFTARFCATEADYAAVKNFALANGFTITGEHDDRVLLDVTARAADVERAFHLHLQRFQHPTEAREFFAPDAEPSVDAALAVVDIQGLTDFVRPHSKMHKMDPKLAVAKDGSAPDGSGSYFGDDFRKAYVPGTTLTGTGQSVGLFELDGYYPADIAYYAQQAGGGRTSIVVTPVAVGPTGWPVGINGGEGEVALDIEMAMAIAPGLSKIQVYEAESTSYINTMLDAMLAASNTVKNLSCSWGWGGGPSTTTDGIFKLMASAGQSFFNAAGDSCAFTLPANTSDNGVDNPSTYNAPSSCPYITQVGAMTLTNGANGAYVAETVWNWGIEYPGQGYDGVGSSGGVSSYYPIPSWQTNMSTPANQGSASQRNIPDVSLTGDNIYTVSGGYTPPEGSGGTAGTSCAAPLWAGFMALVNQEAAQVGGTPAGFINPAIYAIARGSNPQHSYAACFHDVKFGNNYWSGSPSQYAAVTGYDLCAGLGTPTGTNLINALAIVTPAEPLVITPTNGFTASGVVGGPFSGTPQTITLTNTGASSLTWSLINTSAWLTVSHAGGTLAADAQISVAASLTAAANSLAVGTYAASVLFSNQTTTVAQSRQFSLTVLSPLVISPASGFTAYGGVGGNFSATSQSYALTNLGTAALQWGIVNTSLWLTVSTSAGSLAASAHTNSTISLTAAAYYLPAGIYTASVLVTNDGVASASLPFSLQVGQTVVQNGGFETGDFTGWTETGGGGDSVTVTTSSPYVHSGAFGAEMGPSSLSYLSQTFATVPGQAYALSFWLSDADGGSPEIFEANWNSTTVYALTNPAAAFGWTNFMTILTATSTNTVLQFGFENDPSYFGLDDVSVTPIAKPTCTAVVKGTNYLAWTYYTVPGVAYAIQYKTNLQQPNWIPLVTNTATASTACFTNTIGKTPQFFRVEQLP